MQLAGKLSRPHTSAGVGILPRSWFSATKPPTPEVAQIRKVQPGGAGAWEWSGHSGQHGPARSAWDSTALGLVLVYFWWHRGLGALDAAGRACPAAARANGDGGLARTPPLGVTREPPARGSAAPAPVSAVA